MLSELERIKRVSDMMCSGHASLRDRFGQMALILDLSILSLSAWLVALAFVDPAIAPKLTPFHLESGVWLGLLGLGTFVLTLVQLKTDWKGRADAHKRASEVYADVKRNAGYVIAGPTLDEVAAKRILSQYDMASAVSVALPESEFLSQKSRHKTKIEISQYLDTYPSASLTIVRFKLWLRDNMKSVP